MEWEEGDLRLEVGGKDSSARARVLLERPSYQAILQLYASQRLVRLVRPDAPGAHFVVADGCAGFSWCLVDAILEVGVVQ